MFRINHILKNPDKIVPWGKENKYLHWFGLTDGLLWIEAGDSVIYEYSKPHMDDFGNSVIYNDYQLSRFLEDFLELTGYISESVPEMLYDSVDSIEESLHKWLSLNIDKPDEEYDHFYDNEYQPLSDWFYDRTMDSGHLICGPLIGFFRCGDKIKIVWNSIRPVSDGTDIWRYPKGIYEMRYADFVLEISRFISTFIEDMDMQVADVVLNGIPDVYVDTDALISENDQRKDTFTHQLKALYSEDIQKTDWNRILDLYIVMREQTDFE